MVFGLLNKLGGIGDAYDNWKQRRKRSNPVFDVHYLRPEVGDENHLRGALKVAIRNQSDRVFTIQDANVKQVNREDVVQRGGIDSLEIEPHKFIDIRLDFRYRGEEIFNDGFNKAVFSYYLEDEKGGEGWRMERTNCGI
ncbi:MAG: hypothetical protein ABEJ56_00270 [Candidatus Nanohaloarchaea archaeon]